MTLKLEKPRSDAPGYLNRLMNGEKFRKFVAGINPEGDFIELLCDYVLPYVKEPVDREEAKQALLQASEDEYKEVMRFITSGGAENPTAPEPSGKS